MSVPETRMASKPAALPEYEAHDTPQHHLDEDLTGREMQSGPKKVEALQLVRLAPFSYARDKHC